MNHVRSQERQIVQALSTLHVPKKLLDHDDIRALLGELVSEQKEAQANENKLDQLRQEKKEGNFLSNWWNDRDDKIEEAQLDLNRSVGC